MADWIPDALNRVGKFSLPAHLEQGIRDNAAWYGSLVPQKSVDWLEVTVCEEILAKELAQRTALCPVFAGRIRLPSLTVSHED